MMLFTTPTSGCSIQIHSMTAATWGVREGRKKQMRQKVVPRIRRSSSIAAKKRAQDAQGHGGDGPHHGAGGREPEQPVARQSRL